MSTIKTDNEDLVLHADGAGKEIRFQANGVQKASIDSAGLLTATSIDATKLAGALPAIDGNALTALPIQQPDSGWVDLTSYLTNSWVANSASWAPRYRKIGDTVELWGLLKGGTASVALILPASLHPISKNHMSGGASGGAYKLDVNSIGHVDIYAPASGWCSISLIYTIN